MARYLTPSKVGLLVLADLLTTVDLPSKACLNVLNFIASRIILSSDVDRTSLHERNDLSTAEDVSAFEIALSAEPGEVPGRTVYDLFLTKLWDLDGLDTLFALFQRMEELMNSPPVTELQPDPPEISRASPLGQFIRRSCVEFTRLQFSDSNALWQALCTFRASSHSAWAARNPKKAQALQVAGPQWNTLLPIGPAAPQTSTEDTTTLLTFSIHQLQKLGTRIPRALQNNLTPYLSQTLDASSTSLQHFLAFFEHWRAGQYTMALESLHRYFDYSLAARNGDVDGSGGPGGGVKLYYQYALLHLSVLHADFERWGASVEAMEECVGTARENQDTPCLLFALSWLLYLRQAHPKTSAATSFSSLAISSSNQADEIAFLKTKAREGKHWSLVTSALMEEAKGEVMQGGQTTRALEHILQAQWLNVQHDLRTQIPAAALFQAAMHDRLGHSTLSTRIHESLPLLHGAHAPLSDLIRGGCRLAYTQSQSGAYVQALQTLDALAPTTGGVLKFEQRVLGFRTLICMRQELQRSNLPSAKSHLATLLPYATLSTDPDLSFEILLARLDLLIRTKQLPAALKLLQSHITQLKSAPSADIAYRLQLLILKARIFVAGGQAPKAFSIALRAAASAERFLLVPVLGQAVQVLGDVLNELGEFGAAAELCESIAPRILETPSLPLIAALYATLTDAHVGIAGTLSSKPKDQTHHMATASTYLERSFTAYTTLEDFEGKLECLAKKQMLAGWKGDAEAVERAEEMYGSVFDEHKAMLAEY